MINIAISAIARANKLLATIPNSFSHQQFTSLKIYYTATGAELGAETDRDLDAVVIGVGTGGTLTGAGGYKISETEKVM